MQTRLLDRWRGIALILCALAGWGCASDECKPLPGVCPPNPQCVGGFRNTGSASCENGHWVCGRVACTSDGGAGQ